MAGGVIDGQAVDEAITNPAFLYKNANDRSLVVYSLAAPTSGPEIIDVQNSINVLIEGVGGDQSTPATAYSSIPANTISQGDAHDTALAKLARKYFGAASGGGHTHNGTDGEGAPIAASAVGNSSLRTYWNQTTDLTGIVGSSTDVSSLLSGNTPSTSSSVQGIVVNAPYNRVILRDSNYNQLKDTSGFEIYGRLTESAGIWTLAFYHMVAGVETAYTFGSSTDFKWFYLQLYNPINNLNPYDLMPFFSYSVAPSGAAVNSIAPSGSGALTGAVVLAPSGGTVLGELGQQIIIYSPPQAASGAAVNSIAASGFSPLTGAVILAASGGAVLDQSGQTITIFAPTGSAGGNVGSWTTYSSPTTAGLGTLGASTSLKYKVVSDTLYIAGTIETGTVTGTNLSISLPGSYTVQQLGASGEVQHVGFVFRTHNNTQPSWSNTIHGYAFTDGSDTGKFWVSENSFSKQLASNFVGSSEIIYVNVEIPIN